MALTETELLTELEKDLQHPDLLFMKSYIKEEGITADTGKTYEEVILNYLSAHPEKMQKTDTNWSMYLTVADKASTGGSRLLDSILTQNDFNRGFALDMKVVLKDSQVREWGRFAFSSIDREGKVLTLFDMRPEGEKETALARLLRLWSWKESVNPVVLSKALSLPAAFQIRAVSLVTGASNERYGLEEKKRMPLPLKKLGIILGVSELYLFHGFHLVPVNQGLFLSGQYTKAELLSLIERDSKHPESLYQKDYMNRMGITSDTGEPCCQVLAEWLLSHRDIWMSLTKGLYRRIEGSRAEFLIKNHYFKNIRKQKVLPPFGRVLSDDLLFLGSRFQQTGRPSLLLYDAEKGKEGYSLLRVLEIPESGDSLLAAVLRIFTHLATMDDGKIIDELKLPKETQVEGRILLEKSNRQTDLFLRDLPFLSALMRAMGVGLVIMEDGYEALW